MKMNEYLSDGDWIETSDSTQCNLGKGLKDECHKTVHSRKKGYMKFNSFSDNEKALIIWRSGLSLDDDDSVCFHHEKMFLRKYETLQRYCVDPRSIYKKKVSRKYNFNSFLLNNYFYWTDSV